ncbi:uncharacterized protein LOC143880671 [Tasmannia lanceolata]|uniref:uncharacterized protein LOC143880671 n=1 Tax=Tasmannia lanceolata TaxID=3420 RepID=UPI00406445F0
MALNPQVKGVTGTYFCDNNIAMPETQATDMELAKKLWDFSMSLIHNGFPVYRRRRDGRKVIVRGRKIDNRWVVPYNIDLLIKYNAHINVELCAKTKVIKYLFKYIHKGPDRATVVLEVDSKTNVQHTDNFRQENDEVKQYLDCRYISAPEACWRVFEFDLQAQHPSVERLQFHLPEEQHVIFRDNDNLYDVILRPDINRTMFIE